MERNMISNNTDILSACDLCPRECKINRHLNTGFCGAGEKVRVARAALHYMEEPCISGKNGSGTIFFSGCNLKCCYCQNFKLSHENYGADISIARLAEIMLELKDQGANNINLVTGVMFVPQIISALDMVKHKLEIPVVYNCGGYEKVETIKMLENYVDIYLADIKYYDDNLAKRYSLASNYYENAIASIEEMIRQTGNFEFFDNKTFDDEDGMLKSGVIIRHLILPGQRKDSMKIVSEVNKRFSNDKYILSLMSQFTPYYKCDEFKELKRKITTYEYESVVKYVLELGITNAYTQERTSVGKEYTPDFSLQGVCKKSGRQR